MAARAEAERHGLPLEEIACERRERLEVQQRRRELEREHAEERRLTRGRLLAEATAAGMALAGAGVVSRAARAASTARVAIVGSRGDSLRTGTYTLTFQVGSRTSQATADHVVLALPFSTLRDVRPLGSGLSPLKLQAIQQLGMGQKAKLHLQAQRTTWAPLGYSGVSYTDWDAFCVAWDDSVPLGTSGPSILLAFPGGSTGQNVLFGQYTSFSGYEGMQEPNIHFAGEHTDPEEYGFLNDAVASGERAAAEVLHQI